MLCLEIERCMDNRNELELVEFYWGSFKDKKDLKFCIEVLIEILIVVKSV